MAKEYKVGEKYYLPVEVIGIKSDCLFPVEFKFYDGDECYTESMCDKPDILLTAEEIISNILLDNNNFMTMPSKNVVVSEEEMRIKTLTEKIATLTDERDGARKQADIFQEEIKKITADCDKFAKTAKDKADLANKACTERDAAQGDLVTAKAAIDYLQEENNKLKEEMECMDISHKSLCKCNFKYSQQLDDQDEVIRALVEKIRRLEKANETVCITKPV